MTNTVAGSLEAAVAIPAEGVTLEGALSVPPGATGVIVFAHGSGSSRLSPRNNFVARTLRDGGLGTLLFDLLTEAEGNDRLKVFDIELLASRLVKATMWLRAQPDASGLPIGFFGASTGAAAALVAAAKVGKPVGAIVSRGGRPDLAGDFLPQVTAPSLFIVGGADFPVIDLNQEAMSRMTGIRQLAIVPDATHLFEEPGALEEVARLATEWFTRYLSRRTS